MKKIFIISSREIKIEARIYSQLHRKFTIPSLLPKARKACIIGGR